MVFIDLKSIRQGPQRGFVLVFEKRKIMGGVEVTRCRRYIFLENKKQNMFASKKISNPQGFLNSEGEKVLSTKKQRDKSIHFND